MTTYGKCVSCDFPVYVKDNNPVNCPACKTVNQPIKQTTDSNFPWELLGVAGLVLLLFKNQSG